MSEITSNTKIDGEQTQVKAGTGPRWGRIIAWALLLALLAVVGFSLLNANKGPMALGAKMKDFTVTTFDGEIINTSDLRGKVIVINFWASWCTTCKVEAADLENAWQYYKSTGQVVFLGLDYVDTDAKAREYLDTYGITYPNAPDLGTDVYTDFGAIGVPETYIIDQEGKLANKMIGAYRSEAQIRAMIDPLLQSGPTQ